MLLLRLYNKADPKHQVFYLKLEIVNQNHPKCENIWTKLMELPSQYLAPERFAANGTTPSAETCAKVGLCPSHPVTRRPIDVNRFLN